jgi:hypothetical protein
LKKCQSSGPNSYGKESNKDRQKERMKEKKENRDKQSRKGT